MSTSNTNGDAVVSAEQLTKVYDATPVVDHVDVQIERGEFWGLLGPNGAGKTTFLRMLIGNTPPTSGHMRVLGHPVPAEAKVMRRRIGVVPQRDNLDPEFSVVENLQTYAAYFGLSGNRLRGRIEELLRFAALESKADARISTLSGGMQRRLSLSRALVNEPELLVLDEPSTGLDPQARHLIWQRLRELRALGLTLVLTTHYMEEAARLCDRITIMDNGKILDSDRPSALVSKYIEPQVIEVHGTGAEAWHVNSGEHLAKRSERVGETVFFYADDEGPILRALEQQPGLTFLHRPANLEDVFLRLTGRELRDG